jgi:hypothetical protein
MRSFLFLLFLMTLPQAHACIRIVGELEVGTDKFVLDQKLEVGKTFSLPRGAYHINLTVTEPEKRAFNLAFDVQKKAGTVLEELGRGELRVKEGVEADMSILDVHKKKPDLWLKVKLRHI